MSERIVFDMSRLALRFTRPAPNGIDRVDLAFARHFVSKGSTDPALLLTIIGPRTVPAAAARVLIENLESQWRETAAADDDPVFCSTRERIIEGQQTQADRKRHGRQIGRLGRSALAIARQAPLLGRRGLFPGGSPSRMIPWNAVFINVSQFPFTIPGTWNWLKRRPDIRAVFLLHDMLPLTHPEFFPPQEYQQHRNVVDTICRLGHLILVPSAHTIDELVRYCRRVGLTMPRTEVVPLPVDDNFREQPHSDKALSSHPYFVVCGTIEPRKNHLLLLNVWRELAVAKESRCPKLVIVGGRGWHNANVIDMLERCEPIAPYVIEVSGLSTPGLKRLLNNSRGLLMPSFAEGFGLPVAEACAAGCPALVSDIPVFHQFRQESMQFIDPLDGLAWMKTVLDLSSASPAQRSTDFRRAGWSAERFFEQIRELVSQARAGTH